MKRLTKLISMMLVLSFAVWLCVACDKVSSIDFTSVANSFSMDSSDVEICDKVDSKEELYRLCEEKRICFLDENYIHYNSEFSQKLRTYEDSFFEENSLILLVYIQGNTQTSTIETIAINENKVQVLLKKQGSSDDTYLCSITTFLYVIEVASVDVAGTKEIMYSFI